MKPHSQKFLQRRKFFMVLPLLVLPFLTMIFWALGGGQGTQVQAQVSEQAGLNFDLPDPHFAEKEVWDKLTLYDMAERDSAKFKEARESDPYFDLIAFKTQQMESEKKIEPEKQGQLISTFQQKEQQVTDPNEKRVNRKLEELVTEINRASTATSRVKKQETVMPQYSDPQFTKDVDRLERMMEMMNEPQEADPEMEQIANVLEKILDIQHPERVKERLKAVSQQTKSNTSSVELAEAKDNISLLNSGNKPTLLYDSAAMFQALLSRPVSSNGFYGLNDEVTQENPKGNAIEAIIHDTQELVAGSTVKMRLLTDIFIDGRRVPKDQFVYGTCSINGERLTIEINSIRSGNSLLTISLSVYDLDGLEGIYIPGAITRDAAKQASDDALQNIQLMTLDPSIGAQAAGAGIEAAKGLFSKKAKLVKVTVKAGYHVLLKDTNSGSQSQFNF